MYLENKKTDEWYIEWQQVVQRMTTSGTTNDNEWERVVQRVTMSGTNSDNEWQRKRNEWQRITKNHNEWQQMTASDKTNEDEWE